MTSHSGSSSIQSLKPPRRVALSGFRPDSENDTNLVFSFPNQQKTGVGTKKFEKW
jgi:hypothetical protein